ncbi:MAG TPA: helix-turn-helix transcriptional regulator [Thermoanaerobaculia bacterium]|nr:helix-turn-helix transcriptional regulator [Thermoanaerobaculia bacterium]
MTIGERIRESRQNQRLSLTDVAGKADISAATLSRIETGKQGIDLGLFLSLAKILKAVPHELLGSDGPEEASDPLAKKIAGLASTERARLWRDLAAARKERRKKPRAEVGAQFEELLAQFEYLRQEIESVRSNMRRR